MGHGRGRGAHAQYTLPDHVSLEARQLIDACLRLHPSERASIAEICNEPWVVASGFLPPEIPVGPGSGSAGECFECDDEPEKEKTKLVGAARLRQVVRQHWRRAALSALYVTLVGGALLSHMHAADGGNATDGHGPGGAAARTSLLEPTTQLAAEAGEVWGVAAAHA